MVWEITNGVSTVIAGIQGNCTPGTGSGALQSLAHPIDVAFCGNNLYFATHGLRSAAFRAEHFNGNRRRRL